MDSSPTHEILFSEYNVLDHDAAYRPATDTEDERVTQTNFPPNEACGFLTDSECASFQAAVESDSNDLAVEYLSVGEKSPSVTVNSSQRAPHGERLTGAVLFMATEKLRAAADEDFAFVHKIEHDIESFEWVVIYTIYHHSLGRMATGQLRTSVESEAGRLFSTSSIKLLYQRRCVALDDIGTSMSNLLRYITEEQQAPELASLLSQISWDLRYRYEYLIMRKPEPNLGSDEEFALVDPDLYELDQARKKHRLVRGQKAVGEESKVVEAEIRKATEESRQAVAESRKAVADALQAALAGHAELNMWLADLAVASSDRSKGKGKASAQV